MNARLCVIGVITLLYCATVTADPTFTVSTFDSGLDGWQPNKWSTSTVDGLTPGNPYLNMAADGVGELGKIVTFNQTAAWQGNYIASGVTGIELDIINRSLDDQVYLRIALSNVGNPMQTNGTWFVSKDAVVIPTESAWTRVSIGLEEGDMQKIANLMGGFGPESYFDVATNVFTVRILSSFSGLSATGGAFYDPVGVDNIALVPEPSTMPLIGLGGLLIYYGRRGRKGRKPAEPKIKEPDSAGNQPHFLEENRFEQ